MFSLFGNGLNPLYLSLVEEIKIERSLNLLHVSYYRDFDNSRIARILQKDQSVSYTALLRFNHSKKGCVKQPIPLYLLGFCSKVKSEFSVDID